MQNNFTLEVSQRAKVDFTLQLGQVSETVEVAGTAPLLESQSSTLGNVVDTQLPRPAAERPQLRVAGHLTPGVNGTGFSTSGTIMSGTRPDDRRPGFRAVFERQSRRRQQLPLRRHRQQRAAHHLHRAAAGGGSGA